MGRQLGIQICCLEEPPDLSRIRHPRGIPEPDLLAPRLHQPPRDPQHPLLRNLALVGAAERDRDNALATEAFLARACEDPLEPGERLLHRSVDVLLVWCFGSREKDVDLLEAGALLEGVVES